MPSPRGRTLPSGSDTSGPQSTRSVEFDSTCATPCRRGRTSRLKLISHDPYRRVKAAVREVTDTECVGVTRSPVRVVRRTSCCARLQPTKLLISAMTETNWLRPTLSTVHTVGPCAVTIDWVTAVRTKGVGGEQRRKGPVRSSRGRDGSGHPILAHREFAPLLKVVVLGSAQSSGRHLAVSANGVPPDVSKRRTSSMSTGRSETTSDIRARHHLWRTASRRDSHAEVVVPATSQR
jgi:hypothetical protein